MSTPRKFPSSPLLRRVAAVAFATLAVVVGGPTLAASAASALPTAVSPAVASCQAQATAHHFVKAVCGPNGVYGVTKAGGKATHVASASVTAGTVKPMDASNSTIKHTFENNYIEDTTATVIWVYEDSHTAYNGSYNVKLTTNLNGRQPIYSLYLTHKSGGDITVGNMDVGCREDGWFPLVCDDQYPADHLLGPSLSWKNHKGNYLNNADPYHTSFNSHVEVFGDTLPVGTLSSSQFHCPDKTGDSVADKCYFKK